MQTFQIICEYCGEEIESTRSPRDLEEQADRQGIKEPFLVCDICWRYSFMQRLPGGTGISIQELPEVFPDELIVDDDMWPEFKRPTAPGHRAVPPDVKSIEYCSDHRFRVLVYENDTCYKEDKNGGFNLMSPEDVTAWRNGTYEDTDNHNTDSPTESTTPPTDA